MTINEPPRPSAATDVTFETGKLAKQAHGSCVVTLGETQVLATCTSGQAARGHRLLPAHGGRRGAHVRRRQDPRRLLPPRGPAVRDRHPHRAADRPAAAADVRGRLQATRSRSSSPSCPSTWPTPTTSPASTRRASPSCWPGCPFDGPVAAVRARPDRRPVEGQPDLPGARPGHVRRGGRRPHERPGRDRHPHGRGRGARGHLGADPARAATAPTEEIVAEGLEVAKRAIGELIDVPARVRRRGRRRAHARSSRGRVSAKTSTARSRSSPGPARPPRWCPSKAERDANLTALKEELKEHLRRALGRGAFADLGRADLARRSRTLQKKAHAQARRSRTASGSTAASPTRSARCPPRSGWSRGPTAPGCSSGARPRC